MASRGRLEPGFDAREALTALRERGTVQQVARQQIGARSSQASQRRRKACEVFQGCLKRRRRTLPGSPRGQR